MTHNPDVTPDPNTHANHIHALTEASNALANHDAKRPALAQALHDAILAASKDGLGPGEIASHITYDRNHVGRIRRAAREAEGDDTSGG